MSVIFRIDVDNALFLRDPTETELGRSIIGSGIDLMVELGFEGFTFKKLAKDISSTEASIYRYFESKHQFLMYVSAWYWSWLGYRTEVRINNIKDAKKRLQLAIDVMTHSREDDPATSDIDEANLHRIVVSESPKAYLTSEITTSHKAMFKTYGEFCKKIGSIILEINPRYKYPQALVASLITTTHKQLYLSEKLGSFNEIKGTKNTVPAKVAEFVESIAFNTIKA